MPTYTTVHPCTDNELFPFFKVTKPTVIRIDGVDG